MLKKRIFKDISKQNPPFLIFRKKRNERKEIDRFRGIQSGKK